MWAHILYAAAILHGKMCTGLDVRTNVCVCVCVCMWCVRVWCVCVWCVCVPFIVNALCDAPLPLEHERECE